MPYRNPAGSRRPYGSGRLTRPRPPARIGPTRASPATRPGDDPCSPRPRRPPPRRRHSPPPTTGSRPLFNGKDLTGWVQPAADSGATFTVEDGQIVGRTERPPQEERVPRHREALRRLHPQGQGQVQERQLRHPVPLDARAQRPRQRPAGRRRQRLLGPALRGEPPRHPRAVSQGGGRQARQARATGTTSSSRPRATTSSSRSTAPRSSTGPTRSSTSRGSSPSRSTSARAMEVRYKDIEIKTLD